MRWRLCTRAVLLAWVIVGVWPHLFSAPQERDERELRAIRAGEEPVLDGVLDEAIWGFAPRAELFRQKEPTEGQEGTEATYVKVVYSEDSLFFGIVCLDASPAEIVATELRRDGNLRKDDSIWILIDSFHDHRNAFLFATNPRGTQYDALLINEGEETNEDWDETWRVASHVNDEGWSAEVEIPFQILRMRASDTRIGLEFSV